MDQKTVLSILKTGKNVFLTGSAGTGKTYVLNKFIKYLRERKVAVAITASTGIAATHINGFTIHSWSGIGVKNTLQEKDLVNIKKKKYLVKNFENTKVLIIDEISMLHRKQMEMVDQVLRHFKDPFLPFGGLQVVFSGDFFQLPPISRKEESNREKFAFMSQAWVNAKLEICYLTQNYRLEDDKLNSILNEIRTGKLSSWVYDQLTRLKETTFEDNIPYTRLYTHNIDVNRINSEQLSSIAGTSKVYTAVKKGNIKLLETLERSILTDEKLYLKKGAKVMFIKNNYELGYMNGTLGEIVDFSYDDYPIVKSLDGKKITAETVVWSIEDEKGNVLASYTQVPLRLAWAITVHKSQGMTLDAAKIDLSKTFEKGQGYVALSRLKNLKWLHLTGFNQAALEVDELAQKADRRFQELCKETKERIDHKELTQEAYRFLIKSGGITDIEEIEKNRKKYKEKKSPNQSTYDITLNYLKKGTSTGNIAIERGLTPGTIINHILQIKDTNPDAIRYISHLKPEKKNIQKIKKAYKILTTENKEENFTQKNQLSLKAIFNYFNGAFTYDEIRLALVFISTK